MSAGGALGRFFARIFNFDEIRARGDEHGPDWPHWHPDHPGDEQAGWCRCGYPGTPEECAAARATGRWVKRADGSWSRPEDA